MHFNVLALFVLGRKHLGADLTSCWFHDGRIIGWRRYLREMGRGHGG